MKFVILLAMALGCNAQSIQSLTAQIQKAPTASLYVERGLAYLAAGDPKQAIADSDRALDRDSLNVQALALRGQANSRLGRYSAAITDFSGAIALSPGDAALYVARSAAHTAAGDQPRALADRTEALRLDPNMVAELDRRPPSVEIAPPAPEPVVAVTTPASAPPTVTTPPPAKETVVTAPAASESAATSSVNADTHYQRAKELLNQGKPAEAVAELNAAIELQPTNPILFNTRGYSYYLSKDTKRALQDYDEALRLNPDYLNATHNRAFARRSAGDTEGYEADRKREIELGKKLGVKVQ